MPEIDDVIKRDEDRPWLELQEKPLPQFPVEVFPEGVKAFCERVSASLPVPADYMACSVLGAVSSALNGRVIVVPRDNQSEPVNLFLGMCGESGTRKSSAMNMAMRPLEAQIKKLREKRSFENRMRRDKREMLENKLEHIKRQAKTEQTDEMERLRREIENCQDLPDIEEVLTDATTEAIAACMSKQGGKAILYTDEGQFVNILCGSAYQKQGGVANLDTILKGYDNQTCNIHRKSDGATHIDNASLVLTIGLQPSMLKRLIGNDDLSDRGFSPRMLFFVPDTSKRVIVSELPDIPQQVIDDWNELVTKLALIHRDRGKPFILTLSEAAFPVYQNFWQSMEDRKLTEFGYKGMKSWAAKAHGKAARLAGLLALMENPNATTIDCKSMRAAVALMDDYFIPHAQSVFGGPNTLSEEARNILDSVKGQDRFRLAEIRHDMSGQKRFKGEAGKRLFDSAINELAKQNYIRALKVENRDGRGRPSGPEYEVHPDLRSQIATKPTREGIL